MWRTKEFWIALAERAVSTFIEAYLGVIGVGSVGAIAGLTDIPWLAAANIAGLATLIAVGKGIVAGMATNGSPGVTNAEVLNTVEARGAR